MKPFIGAGGTSLLLVGVYISPFTWTDKNNNSITLQHEVAVMKELNSGAIKGMDLIRSMGIVYFSRTHESLFESSWTAERPFEVDKIVPTTEDVLVQKDPELCHS